MWLPSFFWVRTSMRSGLSTGRVVMAILYLAAGAMHFLATEKYMAIMPGYLPAHRELVYVSGAAEMLGGVGLLPERTRRAAAWGLVLLLVAVFPANVTMITEHERFPNVPLWAAWLRLPLQLPLIWWALQYTGRSPGATEFAERQAAAK